MPATGPNIKSLRVISNSAVALSFTPPNVTRGILTHYTVYFRPTDNSNESDPLQVETLENIASIKIDATLFQGDIHYRLENLGTVFKFGF